MGVADIECDRCGYFNIVLCMHWRTTKAIGNLVLIARDVLDGDVEF